MKRNGIMGVYRLRIKTIDGEKIELENVSKYSVNAESGLATVEINGFKQFFNFNAIKYIGRTFDLDGGK